MCSIRRSYILYSETADHNLTQNLGRSEYSYYFVREAFRSLIEKRARVFVVTDPEKEVDAIFDECAGNGEECVFLSFTPPHRSFLAIRCPTIPVFAWEFDSIPSEEFGSDPRNDWRTVLAHLRCAITHSGFSADVVRSAMHPDFPVISIPAPIWDRNRQATDTFADGMGGDLIARRFLDTRQPHTLTQTGYLSRKRRKGLLAKWHRSIVKRVGHRDIGISWRHASSGHVRLEKSEIIYTTIFNPGDNRKNWQDILSAFCIALSKYPNATLILKLVEQDSRWALDKIRAMLAQYPTFECRVIAIGDFLDVSSYNKLIATSKYTVNASHGEGQCLPLMESMSWGKPALAPQHTAMSEYVDERTAFVIKTSLEPTFWPHDRRAAIRAYRHRINWESVADAFADSFRVIETDPQRYCRMSANAIEAQRKFCSEESAFQKLEEFVAAVVKDLRQKPRVALV